MAPSQSTPALCLELDSPDFRAQTSRCACGWVCIKLCTYVWVNVGVDVGGCGCVVGWDGVGGEWIYLCGTWRCTVGWSDLKRHACSNTHYRDNGWQAAGANHTTCQYVCEFFTVEQWRCCSLCPNHVSPLCLCRKEADRKVFQLQKAQKRHGPPGVSKVQTKAKKVCLCMCVLATVHALSPTPQVPSFYCLTVSTLSGCCRCESKSVHEVEQAVG